VDTTAGAAFAGTGGGVATNFAIFSQIYNAIYGPFQGAMNSVSSSLATTMATNVRAGVVAIVMIFSLAMALSHSETPFLSKLTTAVLIPIAVVLYVLSNYNTYVIQPALNFAPSIGNSMVGALGGTNITGGAPFDTVWNHAYLAGGVVMNAIPSGWGNIGPAIGMFICIAIYWMVAGAAIGLAFALYLVSQAGLLLVLAIGPIFVGFGAFQFTRFMLKGFVSALASIICTEIIVLALLALAITVENTILTPLMNTAPNANVWGMIGSLVIVGVLLVVFTVLAFKASAYAVGICGGIFDGIAPWIAAASAVGKGAMNVISSASGATHAPAAASPIRAAGRAL
jgi:type IV secretory pathway VirB6-like protein